jgi:hypothetical protein
MRPNTCILPYFLFYTQHAALGGGAELRTWDQDCTRMRSSCDDTHKGTTALQEQTQACQMKHMVLRQVF